MLTDVFRTILTMSLTGGALAIVLFCLSKPMRKSLSASARYYVWISPILLMLVPISFKITREYDVSHSTAIVSQSAKYAKSTFTVPSAGIADCAAIIWLCVAVLLFCAGAARYVFFRHEMRKSSVRCERLEGIPSRIEVRRTSMKVSPMLVGILKPFLLLPEDLTGPEQLSFVIRHELTHYHRCDVLVRFLASLCICVHWFNPMSYMIFKRLSEECEISCDCTAVRNLSDDEKKRYMNTVLDLLENLRGGVMIAIAQMSGEKRILARRIEAVKEHRTRNIRKTFASSAALGLSILLCACASGVANGEYILVPKKSTTSASTENAENASEFVPKTAPFGIVSETDAEATAADDTSDTQIEAISPSDFAAKESSAVSEEHVSLADNQTDSHKDSVSEVQENHEKENESEASLTVSGTNGRVGNYSYKENSSKRQEGIVCDSEGRIAISLSSNTKSLAKIMFFNSETKALESVSTVPVSENETYVFYMTDRDCLYDVEINSATGSDWVVEGNYTIW